MNPVNQQISHNWQQSCLSKVQIFKIMNNP